MDNQKTILYIIFFLVLAGMAFIISKSPGTYQRSALITNFTECAGAGYPVMESFPRQCRTPQGVLFVETVQAPTPTYSTPSTARVTAGYVSGHVTIGPFCPVERVDEPCKAPPEAYTSREAVAYASNKTTIVNRVHLDAQGDYRLALAPGNYFIQIQPAGIGPGELKPATVKANQTTVVNFDIDTGIR